MISSSSPRISGERGSIASCSFNRVSGVLKSWLTPASIVVLCSICAFIRSRMFKKADAACRTSDAPDGLKSCISRPRPKLSAASARFSIGRIWLRRKIIETARRNKDVPVIQTINICEFVAYTLLLRTSARITSPGS